MIRKGLKRFALGVRALIDLISAVLTVSSIQNENLVGVVIAGQKRPAITTCIVMIYSFSTKK